MHKRTPPAWLAELDVKSSLLCLLASAQSRYESALVTRLRPRFSEKEVRYELRVLQYEQSIELDAIDRVRWRLTCQGRNQARRARDRAQRKAAA